MQDDVDYDDPPYYDGPPYTDVVRAVVCNEPTDANYGGWDILISVPDRHGNPSWCCVAETRDTQARDDMVYVLKEAHHVLKETNGRIRTVDGVARA